MKPLVLQKQEIIKLVTLILFISPLLISCSAYKQNCSNSWQLVYENDKEGNTISGDLDELINAVSDGKEVRVMIYNDNSQHIYFTEAENIWIKNNIVHIQNTSHVSVKFLEDQLVFQDDVYHFYFIFNSKGDLIVSRWYVGEHNQGGEGTYKRYGKWFVR